MDKRESLEKAKELVLKLNSKFGSNFKIEDCWFFNSETTMSGSRFNTFVKYGDRCAFPCLLVSGIIIKYDFTYMKYGDCFDIDNNAVLSIFRYFKVEENNICVGIHNNKIVVTNRNLSFSIPFNIQENDIDLDKINNNDQIKEKFIWKILYKDIDKYFEKLLNIKFAIKLPEERLETDYYILTEQFEEELTSNKFKQLVNSKVLPNIELEDFELLRYILPPNDFFYLKGYVIDSLRYEPKIALKDEVIRMLSKCKGE